LLSLRGAAGADPGAAAAAAGAGGLSALRREVAQISGTKVLQPLTIVALSSTTKPGSRRGGGSWSGGLVLHGRVPRCCLGCSALQTLIY
jgi:hypothetical protein